MAQLKLNVVIKEKTMKKIFLLVFVIFDIASAWEVKEVVDDVGIQTNLIQCINGQSRVVYLNDESGKYEVSPTVRYDTLEAAAAVACGEKE